MKQQAARGPIVKLGVCAGLEAHAAPSELAFRPERKRSRLPALAQPVRVRSRSGARARAPCPRTRTASGAVRARSWGCSRAEDFRRAPVDPVARFGSDHARTCARARVGAGGTVVHDLIKKTRMNPQQIAEQSVRQFLANDTVAQSLGINVRHSSRRGHGAPDGDGRHAQRPRQCARLDPHSHGRERRPRQPAEDRARLERSGCPRRQVRTPGSSITQGPYDAGRGTRAPRSSRR